MGREKNIRIVVEEMRAQWTSDIKKYNCMDYFAGDPVEVVRRCINTGDVRDVEIMGMVCSWLAFGNREQIHKKCDFAYCLMNDGHPYEYVVSEKWREYAGSKECFYRMHRFGDFHDLCERLLALYAKYDSMEDILIDCKSGVEIIAHIEEIMHHVGGIPKDTKSACKRLALFVRWMVRRDGKVDLGVWRRISPSLLLMPLDVHVVKVAHEEGLLKRANVDMKACIELTERCREEIPDDPTAMDYALFAKDISE